MLSKQTNFEGLFRNSFENHTNFKPSYLEALDKNDLYMMQIKDDQQSLMTSVSLCLYSTEQYAQYISSLCLSMFKRMISGNSSKYVCSQFEKSISQISEYLICPSSPDFDYLNLQLVSMIFKVRVIVYFMDDDDLTGIFINQNFQREITIFKDGQTYRPIFTKNYMNTFNMMKKMVKQIIQKVLTDYGNDSSPDPKVRRHKRGQSIDDYVSSKNHPSLDIIWQIHDLGNDYQSSLTSEKVQHSHSDKFDFNFPIKNCNLQDASDFFVMKPSLITDSYITSIAENITVSNMPNRHQGPITPLQYKEDNQSFVYNKAQTYEFNMNTAQIYNDPTMLAFSTNSEQQPVPILKQPKIVSKVKESEKIKEEREDDKLLQEIYKKTSASQVQHTTIKRDQGRLKFFDENKQYGFFVSTSDSKDIFVHLDDMQKSGVTGDVFRKLRQGYQLFFTFERILYQGKQKQNIKAINIRFEKQEAPIKKH